MILKPVLGDVLVDPAERSFGEFLPSELPELKLWTRFNQGITVTGAGVSQWDDQSGEGNHLLQATDANRPSKEADGSILFDGITFFLKASAFTLVQPETIYVLGKQVTWANNKYLFDGELTNSGMIQSITSTPRVRLYAGIGLAETTLFGIDTYKAISAVINGASSVLQFDNANPITGDAGLNDLGGFTLGARGDGTFGFFNAQVKEVLVYSAAHDAVTRAKMIKYLASVGGLSI